MAVGISETRTSSTPAAPSRSTTRRETFTSARSFTLPGGSSTARLEASQAKTRTLIRHFLQAVFLFDRVTWEVFVSNPSPDSKFDLWKPLVLGLVALLFWAMACAAGQGQFGAFWVLYWKVALVAIVLSAILDGIRRGPVQLLATVILGSGILWLTFAGSFANGSTALIDLAAALLAGLLTYFSLKWFAQKRDPKAQYWTDVAPDHLRHLDVVVWGLLAWVTISLASVVTTRPLPTSPDRFARIGPEKSIVPEEARRWRELRIGLALSGGGYRAATFHAGVLQALEDLGIRVNNLSTVSGGSIIGSYYAVGGDPADFAKAVAEGRFNLKRQLLLAHNVLRLPLPLRVPGLDVELFPFYRFDRMDIQRERLQQLLFADSPLQGGLGEDEPAVGQPQLMIAVTDLTYGFQIGLLSDGILKLGDGVGGRNVYRRQAFEPSRQLSLPERVALSGAFPIAFPSRPLEIRVRPIDASGHCSRALVLVDGGLRDNTGHDLLRIADRLADPEAEALGVGDYAMSQAWNLDAILVSDGGAVLGVLEEPGSPLSLLSRMFEVATIQTERREVSPDLCPSLMERPTVFSPSSQFIPPDSQFNLKNDTERRASLPREWSVSFDPAHYPESVLRRLTELLPGVERETAQATVNRFLERWRSHQIRGRDWSRAMHDARSPNACNSTVPGVCEAFELREIFRRAVIADLDVFRATSTLDDTPSRGTVAALERLGKLLVYLSWPRLEDYLDDARTCRTAEKGSIDTPGT